MSLPIARVNRISREKKEGWIHWCEISMKSYKSRRIHCNSIFLVGCLLPIILSCTFSWCFALSAKILEQCLCHYETKTSIDFCFRLTVHIEKLDDCRETYRSSLAASQLYTCRSSSKWSCQSIDIHASWESFLRFTRKFQNGSLFWKICGCAKEETDC